MADYVNFYQQINEANMRLRGTVVLYDGDPYLVMVVSDHKSDGIFRLYLDPLPSQEGGRLECLQNEINYQDYDEPFESGRYLDEYLSDVPSSRILRKKINSPLFNRFRPFPLGMCEVSSGMGGKRVTTFTQRRPTRRVEQGLTSNMVLNEIVSLEPQNQEGGIYFPPYIYSYSFRNTIKGVYPTIDEAISSLSPVRSSIPFSREMAVCSGPVGLTYLFYKDEVVGVLPEGNTSVLHLDRRFNYTKEAISEMKLFKEIRN